MCQTQVPERATHGLVLRACVIILRREMREVFGQEPDGIARPGLHQCEQRRPEKRAHARLTRERAVAFTAARHRDARATLLRHPKISSSAL